MSLRECVCCLKPHDTNLLLCPACEEWAQQLIKRDGGRSSDRPPFVITILPQYRK